MKSSLSQRCVAELVSTALLVAAVVGSGIMSERLAGPNVALALLTNTIATGAVLVALILTFGEISGAHMNPVVTLSSAMMGGITWPEAGYYATAQFLGGAVGTAVANLMFNLLPVTLSQHNRSGAAQVFSECVATFGLVAVVRGCERGKAAAAAFAVGGYITAAYWFTASTSFANPAVTVARSLSDTFAGIRPSDVPLFVAAQIIGAVLATVLFRWLLV
jgi:glycerol uptake facilitator-like aquaporin